MKCTHILKVEHYKALKKVATIYEVKTLSKRRI